MAAIVSIIELAEGRWSTIDEDYVRTYGQMFKVQVDSPTVGPEWVRTNISYALNIGYSTGTESDAQAIVKGITVRQDPTDGYGVVWIVEVNYGPWDPYRHASSPLLLKPLVTMEGATYQQICDADVNGNPIVNTAGDPYDPPVERDASKCAIRIQQNIASFTPSTVLYYSHKINSDTWFGLDPHTCKFDPPKGTPAYHQVCGQYWQVEWNIVCWPNLWYDVVTSAWVVLGWDEMLPSRGYRQYISGTGYQKITNADGSDIDQPAFLDSSGVALAPPIAATSIVWTRWQKYPAINFTSTFAFDSTMFF